MSYVTLGGLPITYNNMPTENSIATTDYISIHYLEGLTGDTGATGFTGAMGPQGNDGPTGNDGARGPTGAAGNDGPTGPQGNDGPTGPHGNDGPTGPQGNDGPTGPQGNDGAPGPTGHNSYLNYSFTGVNGNLTITPTSDYDYYNVTTDIAITLPAINDLVNNSRIYNFITTGNMINIIPNETNILYNSNGTGYTGTSTLSKTTSFRLISNQMDSWYEI